MRPRATTEPLSLKATQRLVWRFITAPEGVAKAVQEHPSTVLPIRGRGRLSGLQRLNIYANMYFYRILDSLKEDFPAVCTVIGDRHFHNLITDYLWQYPSRHWSLRYVGERLPRFLVTHRFNTEWLYLADLARFEWALLTAFDAAAAIALTAADLQRIAPSAWGDMPLQRVPSVQLIRAEWPVDIVRERALRGVRLSMDEAGRANAARLENDAEIVRHRARRWTIARGRIWLLVWRQGERVVYRRSDSTESRALNSLERPVRFDVLCDRVAKGIGAKAATTRVAGWLQQWLHDQVLARPVVSTPR